jgi:hypothetical protein
MLPFCWWVLPYKVDTSAMVTMARTKRLQKSTIPYMERLINNKIGFKPTTHNMVILMIT